MRVLHFAWEFSRLTETFIYDVVLETSGRAEVMVAARRRLNEEARPFEPFVLVSPRGGALGKLRDWAGSLLSPDPTLVTSWVGVRRELTALARSFRPDVIHAQYGDVGVVAAPVARQLGIPLVTTFHGYDASEQLQDARRRRWFPALTRDRNRVIVVAAALRRGLEDAGLDGARISVIPNGKDLSAYPFRERRDPPVRFVTVGRIVDKKGHLDALAALARLAAEGHPVELEIVGDGPLEPLVRARIAALGLGGRVHLAGALEHSAARGRMEASDAFLLCSRTAENGDREGLPMVLLEAQALGLPCVSTRHAGIPEGIPAGNHFLLAEERDVDGIAAAIRRLRAASPEEIAAVSRRGLDHVRARHSLRAQGDALMDVYRAAVAGEAPGFSTTRK